jgi:hypothetical protein
MIRHTSEDGVAPEAQGNPVPTEPTVQAWGGKAVPVKEAERLHLLLFSTAYDPREPRRAFGRTNADLSAPVRRAVPKASSKSMTEGSTLAGMTFDVPMRGRLGSIMPTADRAAEL